MQDSVINYAVLVVTLLPSVQYTALLRGRRQMLPRGAVYGWLPAWWCGVVVFLFVFQVALCFAEDCSGISVVWNALCAHNIVDHLWGGAFAHPTTRNLLLFSTATTVATNLYYLKVAEPITTVAHVCALALGGVCALTGWGIFGRRLVEEEEEEEEVEEKKKKIA